MIINPNAVTKQVKTDAIIAIVEVLFKYHQNFGDWKPTADMCITAARLAAELLERGFGDSDRFAENRAAIALLASHAPEELP
jgi:hypothetical protein